MSEVQKKDLTQLVSGLLDSAPSRVDRAFRVYAIRAALLADHDCTEFKRLIGVLQKESLADLEARHARQTKPT